MILWYRSFLVGGGHQRACPQTASTGPVYIINRPSVTVAGFTVGIMNTAAAVLLLEKFSFSFFLISEALNGRQEKKKR